MYADLRQFVAALERSGQLRRVKAPVSPILEIGAIASRVSSCAAPGPPLPGAEATDPAGAGLGGPALLFEDVEGSSIPVLINAFGSYRRMAMAIGCDERGHTPGGFEALAARIGTLAQPKPPRSLTEALELARRVAPLLRIPPKRRRGPGLCQQVVLREDEIDLLKLPLLRCWPLDGDLESVGYPPGINASIDGGGGSRGDWIESWRGRYITLGGIHTIHADDADDPKPASHNIGMYRVQLLGPRLLAMHWHIHHDGAAHWRSWKRLGRPMPVAIALGGQSVLPYAATCPLPPGLSELLMAGFLNGKGIPLVRATSVPLWVPADAEIIIEGYVSSEAGQIGFDPRDSDENLGPGAAFEGPFGDHTGFYSLPDRYPLLQVTAVTSRRDPIYPTTIVGPPPQEDYFLGKATERIMLPLLKTILPDIEDYDLPLFGAFHNCAALKISKQYAFHARRVMHGVWGAGQMSWTKAIFVVDDDVDVHDRDALLRAAARNCRPDRDLELVRGPLDILDHAAPWLGAGTKIGFDCTRRWESERGATTEAFELLDGSSASATQEIGGVLDATVPVPGWLLIRVDRGLGSAEQAGLGRRVLEHVTQRESRRGFVIALGRDVDLSDLDTALFHWVANWDPGRDTIRLGQLTGFDATPKTQADADAEWPVRDWPPALEFGARTADLVSRRWDEYGLSDLQPLR